MCDRCHYRRVDYEGPFEEVCEDCYDEEADQHLQKVFETTCRAEMVNGVMKTSWNKTRDEVLMGL